MIYENYHKHTHYSNLRVLDSITKPEDYIKRTVEIGGKCYFTTEHGFQGNIFEAYTLCQKYGLKCVYGVEAYYVDDIKDKEDRSNYHIVLIAMTENARREINRIMSVANKEGFYYKPRIDLKLLLSLPAAEVVVTTACVAGRLFKKNWKENFFVPVYKHFGKNFYLEVQAHNDKKQIEYNKMIMDLHNEYNIPIIHANDSHYIRPEDSKFRDMFLKAKGINYEDENGFCLDYPDSEEIYKRYEAQGVLTRDDVTEALNNTLIFENSEGITIDKEFKIPKITTENSNLVLKKLINEGWKRERNNVPKELWEKYIEQIKYEYKIIEDCGMADYFILDHYVVEKAVNEYGAVLTRSGRGSAVSFYVNKLLGLTEVDRISAPITLYPTRFMSAERILSSRSIPDIDLNFSDVKPVIKASKDILGEDGIYYMVAYKPLQESSAFRLWCKAKGLEISEYDDVAKDLENHIGDEKWKDLIEESKIFRGVIEAVAPSPCSFLLSNDRISEMVGLIKVGEEICCCLDGYNCDVYKFLKNDYLTVMVYDIIKKTYDMIGRPIDNIKTLVANCDDSVWKVYEKGLTTTINQADSDYDKQILKKYKPKSLAEMSAYVAAIRPGFSSLLNNFVERKPYTTGVKELDDILEDSFHYLMYQESIMKYLVWLGMEEKGTYDIIKKISKKKFTEEDLKKLEETLKDGWIKKVGTEDGFERTWNVVMDAAHYSFNASHSLSVAIDSMYGAYLKSHYPLEYFTVALTEYSGDMDRTSNLIEELPYFGVKLSNIKFRHSRAKYSCDKQNNVIYKGMQSIKFLNEDVSEKLYEMRDQKFNTFADLIDKFPGNSKQLDILVKLNYFEEFGGIGYLLNVIELYDKYHKKKTFKKDTLDLPEKIIPVLKKYSSETEKMYRVNDVDGFFEELISFVKDREIPIESRLKWENEFLGYSATIMPEKVGIWVITAVDTKYSPKMTMYSLSDGKTVIAKMSKKDFQNNPICIGDTVRVTFEERPKSKLVDGAWVKSTTEKETWIKYISYYNMK